MLTIYNYGNNRDEDIPLLINKQLLYEYKEEGDSCLVNVKRELTRCLVDYKLFQKLQAINNSFFVIVDYLDRDIYYTIEEVVNDKNLLLNNVNIFLRPCKSCLPTEIYDKIYNSLQILINTINKLIMILKSINKNI